MADLEKLLLEAAGRTSNSSGKKRHASPPTSRRRRDSDEGSDSKDDESDDNRGYLSQKPSGPQIPLKKRLDSSERDDNQRSHDEEDDDDRYDRDSDSGDEMYGTDLYKDEHDREKLAKMTELERELILTERSDKIKDKKIREDMKSKKIVKKKKKKTKKTPLSSSGGLRSSSRLNATKTALIELKAKRLNKKQQDDSVTKQDEQGKRRSNKLASPISSSEDDDGRMIIDNSDEDDEEEDKTSKLPTYDDIKEITIRRTKLAKWFMEPFFDELIVGCFVRVGITLSRTGPIYRLCLVRNIDASDPDRQYKFENKMTPKYLNLVWGNENSAARWQMTMISNARPTREEFDQWLREVERCGGRMPNKQDVLEKKESIEKISTFVYNADTVKQMLLEKKAAIWKPLNVAAEKDRLRNEMEVAKSKNKVAEVARIKSRLQELDESRKAQEKDKKAIRLSEMNKRNRFENFKSASELKPVKMNLKIGDDGYDPFSRRWTKSVNYYLPADTPHSDVVPAAEAEALGGDHRAGKPVDARASVGESMESNRGHNFDIVVSLDGLRKYGGVHEGLMARKQRIEATVGVKAPEDDGKCHTLTLSISDYKRRRGLL